MRMILQTTLSLTAAAALVNFWIFVRVVRVRLSGKVIHGDGGNELLARRMRAHLNFAENAPIVLILIGVIEMTGKGNPWLAYVGAAFMLARVAHAIGMDSEGASPFRAGGVMVTLAVQLGLATVAVLIALGIL
jgi:uncharacterized membrane protein YecN with MAPEG domain